MAFSQVNAMREYDAAVTLDPTNPTFLLNIAAVQVSLIFRIQCVAIFSLKFIFGRSFSPDAGSFIDGVFG